MAGPFSRLLSARPRLGLLALAGAGSLAAGFLLRPEPLRAAGERRRLYPPRYCTERGLGHALGCWGAGRAVVMGRQAGGDEDPSQRKGLSNPSGLHTVGKSLGGEGGARIKAFLETCNP